jgi:hypothetical protein
MSSNTSTVTKIIPDYLAKKNAHPRDQYIEFDEGPHIYTVHGKQGYTSVTTWNHTHFGHFDSEGIVNNILKGKKIREDPTYKYYGMTREQILKMWDDNTKEASGAGTQMHYDIECFYNGMDVVNDSIEYQFFEKFIKDFPDLKAYRTEWMVFYEELKLSGSIDMVFELPDGTLQIYDWKRSKGFSYGDEGWKTKYAITECIKHLPDANFWHYSLQLNTYKVILEHKYGKKISGMYLVRLHPENPSNTYERVEVPLLEKEMADLLEFRRKQVAELV